MAHALILGMTESGKTTLAKKLASNYRANGVSVLVLDPLSDPSWDCDFRTSDVDEFLAAFWASRSCAVFVDEAGDSAGQHDKDMQKTATRGRHWGHRCHYISQRGTMINRTIRDQCSHIFLFGTALEDCKTHALEWNAPKLLQAANFRQGEYFHKSRFGDITQSNIFTGESNATDTATEHDSPRPSDNGRGNSSKTENAGNGKQTTRTRGKKR